ncbi:NAD(P)H-binding protein [Pseudonocardia acaciae]|uniref:NAD(P)H-binding protein n=1 Tax=Pseudonocardia acaciae TaxID=551276 RepID=UPI001B804C08|nr:NAD(P)H-binding protein [Pseudonocardia acaciae]
MILVTGATGNVGRPLIDLLVNEGAGVRAVSRDPGAAGLPAGVEVVAGDPSRPDTITAHLSGVTSVFLNPRAVGTAAGELVDLLKRHEVTRVVTVSAINCDDDPARQPSRYRGELNKEVEDAVVGSGLEWVSLRSSLYASNGIGQWAAQIRAGDVVFGPYAAATAAPIDERDIAAVGARALLGDGLLGRRVELTGPDRLTQREMVTTIGDAIGRSLRYQEIPPDGARNAIVGIGFPEGFADALLAMQAGSIERPAPVTGEVATILGRPALAYARWAADHAEAFQRSAA